SRLASRISWHSAREPCNVTHRASVLGQWPVSSVTDPGNDGPWFMALCRPNYGRKRRSGRLSMAHYQTKPALDTVDPVWVRVRREAEEVVKREPELATFIY